MASFAPTKPTKFLHEPATDFIDNRVHLYGEAFANSRGVFDPRAGKYLPPGDVLPAASASSSELQAKYLEEALEEFKRSYATPKSLAQCPFQIRDKSNWDEIISEMKKAETSYFSVAGPKRVHHRAWRWFGRNAVGLRPLAGAIPQGDYTAPISASVHLIFNAATRMDTLRETSVTALESISGPFEDVADYLDLYAADERIGKATVALYISILAALEEVLEFYTKPSAKHSKVLIKGEKYNVSLETKISRIEANAHALVHQAEKKSQQFLYHYAENSQRSSAELMNWMLQIMRDMQRNSQWVPEQVRQALENHFSRPLDSFMSQSQLLELLTDNQTTTSNDLSRTLSAGMRLSLPQQNRALWLMRHPRLQQWFQSKHPDELLIHGNSQLEKVSPVSLFCAMLLRSLGDLEPVALATFFCGVHCPTADDNQDGPTMLIRNLIVQLLRQSQFDLSFLRYDDVELIQSGDNIDALCKLFSTLTSQLRGPTVLFCVLDSINYYETEDRLRGTGTIFQQLKRLVARGSDSEEESVIFKLLVTSPTKTRYIVKGFEVDKILGVPPDVA